MKVNCILSVFIFFSLVSFSSYSQSEAREHKGDENQLRMCIQWNDSTEYQTPSYPKGPNQAIYKFQSRSLFWGIYKEPEIYIATAKYDINKFNPLRELKHDYFWSLRKSEYTVNGFPVYYHYGNF